MSTSTSILRWIFCPVVALALAGCGEGEPSSSGNAGTESPAERESGAAERREAAADPEPVADGQSGGGEGGRRLTPEEQRRFVDEMMRVKSRQQAEGLGGGSVEVNGAWNYTGYSYLSPNPNAAIEARLVAVDVTLSGHTPHFDIDDIEIVDGDSLVSYGSDPHATPLTLEGELLDEAERPVAAPRASRWLLIYAYPEASPDFHLYYWGKQLTPEPVPIAERGMELPYPARGE